MADVRPFRAVLYARPSAEVTAPPYDVIDDQDVLELRARDPHNVVHLTSAPDAELRASATEAGSPEGVLVREASPAVWYLEQDYVGPDGVRAPP